MKKLLIGVSLLIFSMPCMAVTTVEFGQGVGGGSTWTYTPITPATPATGTLSFAPAPLVVSGMGNPADPLVGAYVQLPSFALSGSGGRRKRGVCGQRAVVGQFEQLRRGVGGPGRGWGSGCVCGEL